MREPQKLVQLLVMEKPGRKGARNVISCPEPATTALALIIKGLVRIDSSVRRNQKEKERWTGGPSQKIFRMIS